MLFEATDGIYGNATLDVDISAVSSQLDECERIVARREQQSDSRRFTVLLTRERDTASRECRSGGGDSAVPWWIYVVAVAGAVICVVCVVSIGGGLLGARNSLFMRRLLRRREV